MVHNILLVKDDTVMRDVMSEYLTDQGYNVVSFETAEDALKNYGKEKYGAIVTDYNLPGISGIDFIKKIREKDQKIGIVVSSLEMREVIENQSDGLSVWEIVTDFSELSLLKKAVKEACEYTNITPEAEKKLADEFASEIIQWKDIAKAIHSIQ